MAAFIVHLETGNNAEDPQSKQLLARELGQVLESAGFPVTNVIPWSSPNEQHIQGIQGLMELGF